MSRAVIEVTKVGPVWRDAATDGQKVSFELPAGCTLTRDGKEVPESSPFAHSGERAEYRIDCVSHDGKTNATAMLEII